MPVFVKIRPRWNFWVSFFKKLHQKGLFGVEKENSNFRFLTADSRKLQTVALKQLFIDRSSIDIYTGVFLGEMCSDRCKNHCCRQKIPEGTSSAMLDVRTIAKCCEYKRCTSTRLDVTRVTQVTMLR